MMGKERCIYGSTGGTSADGAAVHQLGAAGAAGAPGEKRSDFDSSGFVVVTFDQHPSIGDWLGVKPTLVSLPLMEMGRRLAQMTRDLVAQKPVESQVILPAS